MGMKSVFAKLLALSIIGTGLLGASVSHAASVTTCSSSLTGTYTFNMNNHTGVMELVSSPGSSSFFGRIMPTGGDTSLVNGTCFSDGTIEFDLPLPNNDVQHYSASFDGNSLLGTFNQTGGHCEGCYGPFTWWAHK
jgi:hypothetical protein